MLAVSRLAHRDILGTELDTVRCRDEIERLSRECARRLSCCVASYFAEQCRGKRAAPFVAPKERRRARKVVGTINRYLFDEIGLRAEPNEERVGHLFLDSVLETGKGPCLALSGLYLAIAQRLGLPFFGVVVPGHFFVRYDDGRVRINVETLKKGASTEDDWYRQEYRVPPGSSCYLRNLGPEEALAPHFFNLGNAYRTSGRPDLAIEAYRTAAELLPGFAEAHGNLGVVYFKKGETEKAISEFKAAIEANPLLPGAYLDLGAAYQERGRPAEAASSYKEGLAVSPHSAELYHALGTLRHRQGRLGEAVCAYRRALAIRPAFARAHRDLAAALDELGEHEQAKRHFRMASEGPTSESE